MSRQGRVYLVGAGPGDEGLLTLRGAELLRACDCIVYDSLASDKLLAYGKKDAERIFVGKRKGCHSASQEEINEILIQKARAGCMVVRLKGGDPFVFGRGGEEAMALSRAGILVSVVPGVTSAVAVPAAAGIPVTHRKLSRSIHVFTGHTEAEGGLPEDIYHLGNCGGSIICLMGLSRLGEMVKALLGQGWNPKTPAAVIQEGTMPQQKEVFGTLETIEEKTKKAGLRSPAVIVAGETAGLRLGLEGRINTDILPEDKIRPSVGVVGTSSFTGRMIKLLEQAGIPAETAGQLPLIFLNKEEMERSYEQLPEYTWLVFTSANGVRRYLRGFFQKMSGQFHDLRKLGAVKIAVIGTGTQLALEEFHLRADYMPEQFTSLALGQGLVGQLGKDDRVLIPRAKQGSKDLTQALAQASISYTDLPLYDVDSDVSRHGGQPAYLYDYLVFGSGSGVRAFFSGQHYPRNCFQATKFCCIGEITAQALREAGYSPDCIAKQSSAEGLVREILRDYVQRK